ncbi:MAG: DUF4276 family protein [Candidatus Heimdallarchaeota archaeon]|nr:DUF4276 family protein [Candidatus Heimdallarchaeota archaeon]
MRCLVCLLEEPSAKEMVKGVFSRILTNNVCVRYIVFAGKQDLEKQLKRRLRLWQMPDSVFLIMRDQDSGDCKVIKQNLLAKVIEVNKENVTIVRIACHELESFYLGDLKAVEEGLQINGLALRQNKRKYRNPDNLSNASQELSYLTQKKYQKIAGSRVISSYLKTDGSNQSHSFNVLLDGIRKLVEVPHET